MTNPFHFPNGELAYSAEDLLELCQRFPDDGVNYLVREDLEKWLAYIGKEDIAQCAASARQTPLDDRQKLEEFLNKCHALSSPESRDLSKTSELEQPAVETTPEPAPVAVEQPVVETAPKPAPTNTSSTEKKPSFFKVVAKLIVNVLYRNKDKK